MPPHPSPPMHPDQYTSDKHRYHAPDSNADQERGEADVPQAPEISQEAEADLEATSETVATPDVEGARVAEAGNAYVGRQMDDALKSSPRVEDADEAVDEDPTTPGNE